MLATRPGKPGAAFSRSEARGEGKDTVTTSQSAEKTPELERSKTAISETANLVTDYVLGEAGLLRKESPTPMEVALSLAKLTNLNVSYEEAWTQMKSVIESRLNSELLQRREEAEKRIPQVLADLSLNSPIKSGNDERDDVPEHLPTERGEVTVAQIYEALGLVEVPSLNQSAERILDLIRGLRNVEVNAEGEPEISFLSSVPQSVLNKEKARAADLAFFNESGILFFQVQTIAREDVGSFAELVRNALALNSKLSIRLFVSDADTIQALESAYARLKNKNDGIKADQFRVLNNFEKAGEIPTVVVGADIQQIKSFVRGEGIRFLDGARDASGKAIPKTRQTMQGLFGAGLALLLSNQVEGIPSENRIDFRVDMNAFGNFLAFVNFISIQARSELRIARAA